MLHQNKSWWLVTALLAGAQTLIACPYEPAPSTPLLDAVCKNDRALLHEFLTKNPGTDINAKDNDGFTVLMHAASAGQQEMVQELLANHADLNAKTDHCHHCACGLIFHSANETALIFAAERGQLKIVQDLVAAGADVNVQRKYRGFGAHDWRAYDTALMLAVRQGHTAIVHTLLQAKANINLQDDSGSTALMAAASNDKVDMVTLLLEQPDIQVHLTNNKGQTALQLAPAGSKTARVIKEFLDLHPITR